MKISGVLQAAMAYFEGSYHIGVTRAALDFGNIAAGLQSILTITVTGALPGDFVDLGFSAAPEAGLAYTAYVYAADTVSVTCINNTAGAIDPASLTFTARVSRRGR